MSMRPHAPRKRSCHGLSLLFSLVIALFMLAAVIYTRVIGTAELAEHRANAAKALKRVADRIQPDVGASTNADMEMIYAGEGQGKVADESDETPKDEDVTLASETETEDEKETVVQKPEEDNLAPVGDDNKNVVVKENTEELKQQEDTKQDKNEEENPETNASQGDVFIATFTTTNTLECALGESKGENLALKKETSQSSTNSQFGGESSRAVDGNINQNWSGNSITATDKTCGPSWQVDLGGVFDVGRVLIYSRLDCCTERLKDFTVELLNDKLEAVQELVYAGEAKTYVFAEFPAGSKGKFVRIRFDHCDVLSLAEVEVYAPTIDASTLNDCLNDEQDKLEKTAKEKHDNIANTNWGEWDLTDSDKDKRPNDDYCGKYPNRDIPGKDFPDKSWQKDAEYVKNFLDEGSKLVLRAREVILTEYGHGLPRTPEETEEANKMFHVHTVDLEKGGALGNEWASQGGWTTQQSLDSLSRRLLHAIMTQDTFTVVMGGHSAAAGHGNHFKQSYMMQFHQVMEPIFDRLGVKLITRNQGQGGLGTMQNSLGSRSIYGDDIDVLLWDSHMTENESSALDLFYRQSLLGSKRAPVLLCNGCGEMRSVLHILHSQAGAAIGELGSGDYGLPVTEDVIQVHRLPYSAQYMKCSNEMKGECGKNKFRSQCWVDRDDFTPLNKQDSAVGGQASWHPGFRSHRLTGRILSVWILKALEQVLLTWTEKNGDILDDDLWHVTEHYESIKKRVQDMKDTLCEQNGKIPKRVCHTPLYARTEYTPRVDPENTSIISIMKPAPDGYLPKVMETVDYGDDVPNPALIDPEGEIDAVALVSAKKQDQRLLMSKNDKKVTTQVVGGQSINQNLSMRRVDEKIVPGRGWSWDGWKSGFCDGSFYSICGREKQSTCLLSGHNDSRGGVKGDGLSGWLVVELKNLKEGLVILNIDFWHGENPRTQGWTEVNDGKRNLKGRLHSRNGSSIGSTYDTEEFTYIDDVNHFADHVLASNRKLLPEGMVIDYAINGKITSLDKDGFAERYFHAQRVVELLTIMDDPEWAKGEVQNVELALRVRGCTTGKDCSLFVNHIYWA